MAGVALGFNVKLHRHQTTGHISERSRTVAFSTILPSAVLILTEGELARSLLDVHAIHALNKPTPRQYDDPLRRRILMPIANPADWLDGKNDGGIGALHFIIPLRLSGPDALQLVVAQRTAL